VFLDEPTSGLDSYSALNMVALLKKVSAANAAILCTIHQPSSEVFELFDMAIFMKDGMIFYHGPVSDITRYFSSFGYECPVNYNPSDFVMHLCQAEPMDVLVEKGMFRNSQRSGTLTGNADDDKAENFSTEFVPKIKSSYFKQLYWLCGRELTNIYRDTTALGARFGITIFLNLIFGLIFLNAGGKDDSDPDNFSAHFGAITMIFISSMFGPAQSVMLAFPFERPMFMREYATGTCKYASRYIGAYEPTYSQH
jgi:ABC-2 type transporter